VRGRADAAVGKLPWTAPAIGVLLEAMIFDLFFLGLPIAAAVALANLALKDGDMRFWRCSFSFIAYCAFYLAGGRDVILYIMCGMVISHGWVGSCGAM
jgi:hypothetical protein